MHCLVGSSVTEDSPTDRDQSLGDHSSVRGTEKQERGDDNRKEKRKIAFFSGNPTVEIAKGYLHIYKNKCVHFPAISCVW